MSEQVSNKNDSGPGVECAASQRKVPGSTPGQPEEQFQTEPPKLRYQGEETPYKRDAKRPFTELSPVSETDDLLNSEDMWKSITEKIRMAINNVIPSIVENIVAEVQSTLKAMLIMQWKRRSNVPKEKFTQRSTMTWGSWRLKSA